MNHIELIEDHPWQPLSFFGLTHSFFNVNQSTIIYTWVALGIILILALLARFSLRYPNSLPAYITEKYFRVFINLSNETFQKFEYRYCAFITSLFTFLVVCNCLIVIPTMEEPTKDINTTFALSLISFFFIQRAAIATIGAWRYLRHYIKTPLQIVPDSGKMTILTALLIPFKIIINLVLATFLFPIEVMGKLATVLSLSFRLFGNILGGSIISMLWGKARSGSILLQLVGLLSGLNLLILFFFGIFEGLMQAFVFTILTTTYLGLATSTDSDETKSTPSSAENKGAS